jgi:hypothetical protein
VRTLGTLLFVLVALSFGAKEDFVLPLLGTAVAIALAGGGRRWWAIAGGIGGLFAATIVYNRLVGSVFVSGMRGAGDPYFVDLSPGSLWATFAKMLLEPRYSRSLVLATLVVVTAALLRAPIDRGGRIRFAALPAIAVSALVPYCIFPNHVFVYYAFPVVVLLAAVLATSAYAAAQTHD